MDFMDFKDKIWQPYLEAILELKEKKKRGAGYVRA